MYVVCRSVDDKGDVKDIKEEYVYVPKIDGEQESSKVNGEPELTDKYQQLNVDEFQRKAKEAVAVVHTGSVSV